MREASTKGISEIVCHKISRHGDDLSIEIWVVQPNDRCAITAHRKSKYRPICSRSNVPRLHRINDICGEPGFDHCLTVKGVRPFRIDMAFCVAIRKDGDKRFSIFFKCCSEGSDDSAHNSTRCAGPAVEHINNWQRWDRCRRNRGCPDIDASDGKVLLRARYFQKDQSCLRGSCNLISSCYISTGDQDERGPKNGPKLDSRSHSTSLTAIPQVKKVR